MKIEEKEVLKKVFWPEESINGLGNLFFNKTDDDFVNTKTIGASRTEKSLEVFYCIAPMMEPEKKEYFVKLIFDKDEQGLTLNAKKSSPEIQTEKDMLDVLNNIQNSLAMMSVKPEFFMTGTVKSKLKNQI